jgi:hypothetical protein
MLTALTMGLRFRLGIAFAIFAALCFVAPPAAQALGHGKNTIDCLARAGMVDHGRTVAHHPTGDADHGDHSAPSGDRQMSCCALICLSALAVELGDVSLPIALRSAPVAAQEPRVVLRAPERPDRPPISLLFV